MPHSPVAIVALFGVLGTPAAVMADPVTLDRYVSDDRLNDRQIRAADRQGIARTQVDPLKAVAVSVNLAESLDRAPEIVRAESLPTRVRDDADIRRRAPIEREASDADAARAWRNAEREQARGPVAARLEEIRRPRRGEQEPQPQAQIPEPSSLLIGAVAAVGLIGRRRRGGPVA